MFVLIYPHSQFADEARVFKDIEFFMPQLAHLIIHLDQNSTTQSLERLAMVLCQNSVHTALQLSFLFSASLEDYQPETSAGQKNSECNPYYFKRCARLLQDVERAVIYGSQTLSNKEEKVLKRRMSANDQTAKGPKQIEAELIEAKKIEVANTLSRTAQIENYDGLLNGTLMYKRSDRKSIFATKPWKERHFMVDQRVLLCFREPHSVNPLRTIPLAPCHVDVIENDPKYGDTRFDIVNFSNGSKFQLMAKDKEQRDKWVTFLRR
jgi:phosphatidylinositol 4-kinase